MRSTLTDIAREAGVSSATVDRVLNNRPGVKTRTREVVTEVARRMGYIASNGGPAPDEPTRLAFDFVLPAGTNSFIEELRQQLHQQGNALRDISATVHSIEGFNPFTLAEKLKELEGRSSGVGVVGIDHPAVREAMRSLARSGTPVITLISDIHHVPRAGYVGIDNRSAGRLAGYLMGRLLGPGKHKVALFAGSLSYRGHEEREMGFRHILAEEFPNLEVIDLTEVRDDNERAYEAAKTHLEEHPSIGAIYNIGAGNRGIARALEEKGLARSVIFVGHEITPHTKRLLLEGTMDVAIDQNARVEAREALAQLSLIARGEGWSMHPLRIAVLFKENIPED
ncbi:MAG TPA: LacI family DNA-binding transcriptional regulator [Devosiaceae bacterium]|jgi:LacI family transcriptional regulator|nr:LacI family DNA-binding transcriptional regulator [Devosiaceae bacterium]